ncbi:Acylphosphatase [Handroanthus impetiginosus]|uniref:acylphosphatase n=1 Tax=Handroanthus impetiginosus TaxID=429701 RepID=A0A2G9H1Y1_9LAMI|nr:Acylphosphatase [Handroanthus impetiginosus]
MAISALKSHVFRKLNSVDVLWPHPINNGGLLSRRFPQFPLLLLPYHLRAFRSHSLSFLHCFHLPPLPFRPLLRRRLHPLFSPMSTLNLSQDSGNPTSSGDKTVRVVIKGRVQGVFYRNWTVDNAKELGLNGWVRNRRDGSVEALFSGTPEKVQEIEQRCRRGPPDALVTGLQVFPSTDDPGTTFERKPTV